MSWTADEALKHWQKKGLITKQKADELKKSLTKDERFNQTGMPRAVAIFATVGAMLVGLGILLFIGSNWGDMTPMQRLATVFLGYGVVAAGAYVAEQREMSATSEALWLLTSVVFGANIFLIAQLFHYSLTYWQGPFLWMLGTVAMGYSRQHKVHGFLAVPLFILALGWIDSRSGWFLGGQFEFLGSHANLLPVLSVMGVGLVSTALLLRKTTQWNFMAPSCMKWGALLVAVPLLISTIDNEIPAEIYRMSGTLKQYLVIGMSLTLTALAVWLGDVDRNEPKVYLLTMAAIMVAMLIQTGDMSGVGVVFRHSEVLYFLYILAVFMFALWTVWVGILSENETMVNYGIVVSSIVILIQYFSWSFALLDKSLAFVLGGVFLIVMTTVIEKKRRKILSTFDE